MQQNPLTQIAAILIALVLGLSAAAAETGKSFIDRFDAYDQARWLRSHGWTNGDWMNCVWSRDAVSVRDGKLNLAFRAAEKGGLRPYACGEIQSREAYGHGTYEIVMRTGRGAGLNAAFFTYIGPVHDKSHDEIDIEVLLRDPWRVSFNTYVDATAHNERSVKLPSAADTKFLHYVFTWAPDGVTWHVNGKELHRTKPGTPLPKAPQKIYASLWGSNTLSDWMGSFDPARVPQLMQVDWIAFTRLGEACQFPESILCDWP